MSEQVAELSQTVGGNEYLGRLEQEMDRRLAEAAQTKSLSRKGAVQRLFGEAGENDFQRRDRSLGDWLLEVRRGDDAATLLHKRPHHRLQGFDNLWMVGGGTHPGSGLPVIFLSSEITTKLLCAEEGVPNPLERAVAPGAAHAMA